MQPRFNPELENPFTTGEDFTKLFEKEAANQPVEGNVVKGKIVAIEKDNVIIDIGFKSEGRIPVKEFPFDEQDDLAVGKEVEVLLKRVDNRNHETVISREEAVREEAWDRLEVQHEKAENVKGMITARVKGGFTVDLGGAQAFLPGSQVDVRPVKDIEPLMNIAQPFQILKMDKKRGNIVVSRRAILEETRSAERDEALSGIKEGMVLEGVVKNITDYGAFVDLGALDGLLHVTDISWKRITHPSEVLRVNETIQVKVTKFDAETKRISLGVKQLEPNPWEVAKDKYQVGDKYPATIVNVADYGAFVELEPGLEGLVHVSEISWTARNQHPNKLLSVGEKTEVMILEMDVDKGRLSLGIKQCQDNPWAAFTEKFPMGSKVGCEIKSVEDYGLVVIIKGAEDVNALVHATNLSWDKEPEEAIKDYKKGDKIEAVLLDVDTEKEKINLGIKHLSDDPVHTLLATTRKQDTVTVTVIESNDNGIEVEIDGAIKSFIKRSDLAKERVECRPDRFSVGDRVDAKVTNINKKNRQIDLSIRALEIDEEKQAIKEYGSADSGATLGNILGVALEGAVEAEKKEEKKKPAAKKAPAKKAAAKKDEEPKKAATKKAPAKKPAAKKKADDK